VKAKLRFDDWHCGDWDQFIVKCCQLFIRYLILSFIYTILFPLEFMCYFFGASLYLLIVVISTFTCVIGLAYCKLGMSSQFVTFYQLAVLNRERSTPVKIFGSETYIYFRGVFIIWVDF